MNPTPTIFNADCLEVMALLPDASVDAIVTDPPYGLGFMGKEWDDLPPGLPWAQECLRVLKPGGHLLAFGGTRTWHRLVCAVEDAGFEIRDSIAWLYGSGFPKSLDVSKAIDKAAGAEREVVGRHIQSRQDRKPGTSLKGSEDASLAWQHDITAPATEAAQTWQGWGTALKPAFEPVCVARKPLVGTVAANVLAHGTGALNIDGSRSEAGRWPANVVLDEDQAAALDQQTGNLSVNGPATYRREKDDAVKDRSSYVVDRRAGEVRTGFGDSGGASRFFYVAKAPKFERPVVDGVAHPTVKPLALMRWLVRLVTPPGGLVLDPFAGSGTTVEAALLEGFDVIGIERGAEYVPLIEARIARTSR